MMEFLKTKRQSERYTPNWLVENARKVMGTIDLDPASNIVANSIVRADTIFTIKDNGLSKKWKGNVYMNPPFQGITEWVSALHDRYRKGQIQQAICLSPLGWVAAWQKHLGAFPSVILHDRVKFWQLRDGLMEYQPCQFPIMVTYFGRREKKFLDVFGHLGLLCGNPNKLKSLAA